MRLSELDIAALLPEAMRSDPANLAMARVLSSYIADLATRAQVLKWWDAFERMTDIQLDACAAELKISWYRADMSREDKVSALKDSDWVFRHAGTKAAMENAFRIFFGDPDLYVSEWYEFGGQWGEFQIHTALSESREIDVRFRDVLRDVSRVGWQLANVLHQFSGQGPAFVGVAMHEIETIELSAPLIYWVAWLDNYGQSKIQVVRDFNLRFGMGLTAAQALVDATPTVITPAGIMTAEDTDAMIADMLSSIDSVGLIITRRLSNGV